MCMALKKRFTKDLKQLLYINLSVLIIILSAFNLYLFSKNSLIRSQKNIKVLGSEKDNSFWLKMTEENPTYIDAWIELGNIKKVKEIDPNYFE